MCVDALNVRYTPLFVCTAGMGIGIGVSSVLMRVFLDAIEQTVYTNALAAKFIVGQIVGPIITIISSLALGIIILKEKCTRRIPASS